MFCHTQDIVQKMPSPWIKGLSRIPEVGRSNRRQLICVSAKKRTRARELMVRGRGRPVLTLPFYLESQQTKQSEQAVETRVEKAKQAK
jgi:hypothetical protein